MVVCLVYNEILVYPNPSKNYHPSKSGVCEKGFEKRGKKKGVGDPHVKKRMCSEKGVRDRGKNDPRCD